MWPSNQRGRGAAATTTNGLVAIAIDKDKGSQSALRWTTENLISKGQTLVLIHVVHKTLCMARLLYVFCNEYYLCPAVFV